MAGCEQSSKPLEGVQNEIERTYYFQWAFTTQNFSVICMDIQESGICYWLIEKLTSTQLDVIQALEDPVLHPEVEKDYLSFHSTK